MWLPPGERSPVDERVNQAARASTGPASIYLGMLFIFAREILEHAP